MKTSELISALDLCKSSLLGSDFLPILSHFCFDDTIVYAYNDVSAIIVDVDTGLECAVKGALLLGLLNTLGEEVELKVTDKGLCLKSGKVLPYLATLPAKEFVFRIPEEEAITQVVLTEEMINGLKLCCTSVGEDAMQKEYTGVTFSFVKGGFKIYSTNAATASRFEVSTRPSSTPRKVLVPANSCRQITELWSNAGHEKEVRLSIGEDWLWVTFDNAGVFTKLMTEDPPDYESAFSQMESVKWYKMPSSFPTTIKRAQIISKPEWLQQGATTISNTNLILETDDEDRKLSARIETGLGKFNEDFKLELDKPFKGIIRPETAAAASEVCKEIAFSKRFMGLRTQDGYTCLISLVQE
jgi:DNA polymerase III sliding clamp (beta) subunit (PCNA family)